MANGPDKPLMRSLGEFFGHVAKGIKTDPSKKPAPPPTRATVEERVQETAQGKVILRRTIIEEVVMPHALPDAPSGPPPGNP